MTPIHLHKWVKIPLFLIIENWFQNVQTNAANYIPMPIFKPIPLILNSVKGGGVQPLSKTILVVRNLK